jgi:hypothetical protein
MDVHAVEALKDRLGAEPPPAKEPAKKEVPALAKEIVKMELRKLEPPVKGPKYGPVKTIEDKEKIGQLLALFPEVGADRPYVPSGRSGFNTYRITLHRAKGDPIQMGVLIREGLNVWVWSQGKNGSNGDVKLVNPKEVGKFLDELIEPPVKKEVPALAKEFVKMKVQRVFNEKEEISRAEKTVEDKEKIGELLALFPEVGTDKKPDAALLNGGSRLSGLAYAITLHREKGDPLYITISSNREFWRWSRGKAVSNGDRHLKKAKEVGKFLDELLK